MTPSHPPPPRQALRVLVPGILLLSAAFGAVVSILPRALIQPAIGFSLGLVNLVVFAVFLGRAREPGPEQKGWFLLTLSLLGVMGSNVLLMFTPSPLTSLSRAEILFFAMQVAIALLQAWGLLAWPFRSTARPLQRLMNLLGCSIFGASVFLVLWSAALYQELDHGQWAVYVRMMGLALRVAIVGGVTTYILADDPRRVRGPIGGFFVAAVGVVVIIILARPYLYDAQAQMQPSPWFGLVLLSPLAFGASAWLRAPVETQADARKLFFPLVDALIYLPFVVTGGVLLASALRHPDRLQAPLVGFLGVSALLLARQFLLLRAVRRANERLEERVMERTRSLEDLQKIMLRTERLNSIGVLGAGLTHDLNNALGGIRASAELARLRLEEGHPTSAADLDRILVAADQSATLTGRLMAFARQEEDVPEALDLAAEVSNHEGILRMLLTRNIALKLDLGDRPVRVFGARPQIEQILVNLVGNARDAMPSGGQIQLRVWAEGQESEAFAYLQVGDSGEGMSAETQARIFEPFFTTKVSGRGTGLGLSSVKHLVEQAGGSIQVESQPGQGSRFTLRFPLFA